jgi:hypothetical protein
MEKQQFANGEKINFDCLVIKLILAYQLLSVKLKKAIATFLLSIYLFNIGGQLVMHQFLSIRSDKFFNKQASKGLYNVHDLTEVKLPVNFPSIREWKSYENITGQIQFENVSYNYVKMKMTRNALYLMCIPNYEGTRLLTDNVINAKHTKTIPIPKKNHVPFGKTTVMGNFNLSFTQFAFASFVKMIRTVAIQPTQQLAWHYPAIPEQPPKFAC